MGSSQQQVNTNPSSPDITHPLPYLPTELKLQIIKEAVTFADGLCSDHWYGEQQDLVNKFSLLSHEMSDLVSESLYKANKIVTKPQPQRPDGTTIDGPEVEYGYLAPYPGRPPSNIRPYITYPTIAQSQSVKELEFHLDVAGAGVFPSYYISDQLEWPQKLASGELRFPLLDSLRIVLALGRSGAYNMIDRIRSWDQAPLQFATGNLTIVINGQSCSRDACIHEPELIHAHSHEADHSLECIS